MLFMMQAGDSPCNAQMPDHVRIVLVNPTHPGNIGAAARAMKNMGLRHLSLVDPRDYPSAEATARASGADDILAAAVVHQTLDEALHDCHLVIGTSARLRTIDWPQLDPRRCAEVVMGRADTGRVAILFGREHSGLTNGEIDRCHYLLHIPCSAEYSSLNLAAAVQIVAYELRMVAVSAPAASPVEAEDPVTAAEMEALYSHLEQALIDLEFLDPAHPKKLMRRLRRLFNRSRPDQQEINILRGILTAAQAAKGDAEKR
jgi:tRNA (cytidine32/uridine32-2'-O)-methyltransferase